MLLRRDGVQVFDRIEEIQRLGRKDKTVIYFDGKKWMTLVRRYGHGAFTGINVATGANVSIARTAVIMDSSKTPPDDAPSAKHHSVVTSIRCNAVIMGYVVIGDGCIIGAARLSKWVKMGNGSGIFGGSSVWQGTTIGEHTLIMGGVTVMWNVEIGDNVKILTGAVIHSNAHIGNNTIIGRDVEIPCGEVVPEGSRITLPVYDLPHQSRAAAVP